MKDSSGPVFVFESQPPWHVVVYPSLAEAIGSIESQDVSDDEAYTVTGQAIRITPISDLYAHCSSPRTSIHRGWPSFYAEHLDQPTSRSTRRNTHEFGSSRMLPTHDDRRCKARFVTWVAVSDD